MISQIVHAQHKKPSDVFLPGRLPDAYSVLAEASARVYHAQLSHKNAEWCYSRLRGTLVLGKDIVQAGDPPNAEAENHWFRLLDADSKKPVWMFRIPAGFSYQLDRPFFHVFQGRSRRFGFLFEDDDEAAAFATKVTSQTQPPRKHRSLSLSRKGSILNQGSRRTLSPAMISAPTLHSFVHVAHVGINDDGAIEASKGIDPSWKAVLGGLHNSRSSSSKMVPENFVDGFWKDVDAMNRSGSSSETTIFRLSPR